MTVNAINGTLLSALSAVDGVSLSTLSAINGQSIGTADPGSVLIALSGDLEPTNGGAPRWFDGIAGGTPTTSTTPTGVHDHAWSTGTSVAGSIDLATPVLTFSAGRRIYITSDTAQLLMRFSDGAAGEHIEVRYVAGGNFRVTRNAGATQLAISTGGHIALNTQYYIEITAVVDDSAGSFTCNLHNDSGSLLETISASGVDTRDGAGSVSTIVLGGGFWEDFNFDTSGTLYGRTQVETFGPTGDGDIIQLTPSSGANWTTVDEKPVSTSDHNTSSGADQIDLYTFPSRSVTGTPRASGVSAAIASTSGTPQFKFVCRKGGVTYEHATTFTSSTTSKFYGAFWQNDPSTGFAWTDSGINAAQFGVKWLAANGRQYGVYRTTLVQL